MYHKLKPNLLYISFVLARAGDSWDDLPNLPWVEGTISPPTNPIHLVHAIDYKFSIAFSSFCHFKWMSLSTKCLAILLDIIYDFVLNLVIKQISGPSSMKQQSPPPPSFCHIYFSIIKLKFSLMEYLCFYDDKSFHNYSKPFIISLTWFFWESCINFSFLNSHTLFVTWMEPLDATSYGFWRLVE